MGCPNEYNRKIITMEILRIAHQQIKCIVELNAEEMSIVFPN